uniref:Uncharacterized protein n=1 Tax=Oryza meridionalis TaxID=40149 RepID=A0A0E0EE01_9ORYZ
MSSKAASTSGMSGRSCGESAVHRMPSMSMSQSTAPLDAAAAASFAGHPSWAILRLHSTRHSSSPPSTARRPHAVAVHVALGRGAPRLTVLRRHVPHRAGHHRADVGVAGADHPGQPEVRHLGAAVAAEEHIAGLHVAVHHGGAALVVQEHQRARHADGRVQPPPPPERGVVADEGLQVAAVEVLVDQDLGRAGEAPAVERDQVRVRPREPHPVGEHLHLGAELALAAVLAAGAAGAAVAEPRELLDRHVAAVGENAAPPRPTTRSSEKPLVAATMSWYVNAVLSSLNTFTPSDDDEQPVTHDDEHPDGGDNVADIWNAPHLPPPPPPPHLGFSQESDSGSGSWSTGNLARRLAMMNTTVPAMKAMMREKTNHSAMVLGDIPRPLMAACGALCLRGPRSCNVMRGSPRKESSSKVPSWPVVGTSPERSGLYDTLNLFRPVRLPRLAGSSPEKLLYARSSISRHRMWPISGGIPPEMLLFETFSTTSGRRPYSGGIPPEKLFAGSIRYLRLFMSATSRGSSPENWLKLRSSLASSGSRSTPEETMPPV